MDKARELEWTFYLREISIGLDRQNHNKDSFWVDDLFQRRCDLIQDQINLLLKDLESGLYD